jgi:hypothetical protein
MTDATPPTPPLITQALIDRITAAAALPADASTDTPPQRDMRTVFDFIGGVLITAKQAGDQAVLDLFEPALTNIELP